MSQLAHHTDRTIVAVDPNPKFLRLLRMMLRDLGFQYVYEFTDPREAFLFTTRVHVDVVISELAMKPFDGFQLADKIRHADVVVNRVVPIILATGLAGRKHILAAISHGIDEVLVRPFSARQLHDRLVAVLDKPRVYIKTPSGYFGPDRRRQNDPRYHGPERRKKAEAVVIDDTALNEMREAQRRKYGKVRPSPLDPEALEPLLVGPIMTIPVSVINNANGLRAAARVPTPLRKELETPQPLELPADALVPVVTRPAAGVPIAAKPKAPEKPADPDFHVLDL